MLHSLCCLLLEFSQEVLYVNLFMCLRILSALRK